MAHDEIDTMTVVYHIIIEVPDTCQLSILASCAAMMSMLTRVTLYRRKMSAGLSKRGLRLHASMRRNYMRTHQYKGHNLHDIKHNLFF